jgi:CHAT domain-containing protein/tetratricopeptide (TPR) repeat protein
VLLQCIPGYLIAQSSDSTFIKRIDSLIQVSRNYTSKREFEKAIEINSIAEQISLDYFGKESASYGSTCFNHGRILYVKTDFVAAEKWYVLSKDIREKVLGKDNLDYAASLNNLAVLYVDCCNFEKAKPLHEESKKIREKLLGKDHASYGTSLNNLAILYKETGEYEKAEELYLEAKGIWEKKLGKDHPSYASNLHNLASLYVQMGNFDRAEQFYLEALAIRKKILGTEHPDYAKNLLSLANIYQLTHHYEKAEEFYLEVKKIRQKVLGVQHMDYAACLNDLGALYNEMNKFNNANELLYEAKDIYEKTIGKQHNYYTDVLSNLGNLYSKKGDYQKAEEMYLEARKIYSEVFGRQDPVSLRNLVKLYWLNNQFDKAFPILIETWREEKLLLKNAVHHLSENELNSYITKFKETAELLYSIQHNRAEAQIQCYDNSLFYKGFLLNVNSSLNNLIYGNSIANEDNISLKSYQRRLAIEYSKPISQRNQNQVQEFEENVNTLEKKLAKDVSGLGEVLRDVNYKEVQSKLTSDQVSIEFVNYRLRKPEPKDSIMYAAMILRGGNSEPQFISLFEERELVKIINENSIRRMEYVSSIYQGPKTRNSIANSSKSLFELIWKPITPFLKGVSTIYYSPSGLLHQINQNAICMDPVNMLSDVYNLVLLGSTRELIYPFEQLYIDEHTNASIFGGLSYELDTTLNYFSTSVDHESITTRSEFSISRLDSTSNQFAWKFLKDSEKEVTKINSILVGSGIGNSKLYMGKEGSEEVFKTIGNGNMASPGIIHLATHAYFFQELGGDDYKLKNVYSVRQMFRVSEKPMIRSGLILSGANYAWRNGTPFKSNMEDGILTAYEISQLNLRNTKLVVLSACETGLGKIDGNEGVYGLQRAFKIAGVKNILMSLWQVPDKQTTELMELFYKNWVNKKLSIRDALSSAQNTMRKKGLEPYYWAGFVLME